MKTSSVIFLGLALLFQAACNSHPTTGPADTIRQIFSLIEKGQVEDAAKLCTERYQKDEGGIDKVKSNFAALTPKIQSQGGMAIEIVSEEITGEVAVVTFNLHYGNGQIEPGKYKLLKENGEWKHDGNA